MQSLLFPLWDNLLYLAVKDSYQLLHEEEDWLADATIWIRSFRFQTVKETPIDI